MLRRGHAILAANPHVVGFAFSPGWGLQVYTAAGMPLTRAGGWSAYLRDATPGALEQRTDLANETNAGPKKHNTKRGSKARGQPSNTESGRR